MLYLQRAIREEPFRKRLSFPALYLLHRFYNVLVEMSKTLIYPTRMFQGAEPGYKGPGVEGWQPLELNKNRTLKTNGEKSPQKLQNPNGPRYTSPIRRGPLFDSPTKENTPRNSPTPRRHNNRTPTRKNHRNKTPNAPYILRRRGRFAPRPRYTRRRR